MKRKFLTNTYLRGVDNYMMMQLEDKELNCYSVIKKVNSIDKPYITTHVGKDICLLKEGYYMVEYLPKDEHYGVRVFLDDEKETISYYIDIIDSIGIEVGKGLYYDDLYLDITIDRVNDDVVRVWDEDELQKALEENDIDQIQYDMAYSILNKLLEEIAEGKNIFVNNDHKKYIEEKLK